MKGLNNPIGIKSLEPSQSPFIMNPSRYASSGRDATRGVIAGGWGGSALTVMDYVTIATTSGTTTFGDMITASYSRGGAVSDAGRGVFGGGYDVSAATNAVEYITVATASDATAWGATLSSARYYVGAVSSGTRGVWGGGSGSSNLIDYITIATTGTVTTFGATLLTGRPTYGAVDNRSRGVFGGAGTLDYITIATT